MSYTDAATQLIINDISNVDISTITFNPNELYLSPDNAVYSVNNVTPINGNVTLSIPSEVTETTVSGWGFTKNTGTVTSVNNVSPVNGNVTLTMPTVDQTYDGTSINAQSGVAIEGAGFIKNVASGTDCIGILGVTSSASIRSISIGKNSHAEGTGAISICSPTGSNLHLGAYADGAIQIGVGKNTNANTLQVGSYQLLDENGIIPDVRISKQTTLSSSSTDIQIPSAKCVYDNLLLKADTSLSNVSSIDANSAVQTALDSKADTTLSNVTSIDANSAVQTELDAKADYSIVTTLLNGKANTSLSNLNSTGQAVLDGQWVAIPYSGASDAIVYSATAPTSDLTKSLASKLPNDNYSYEVIFTGAVTTGNTSGNQTRLILSSSAITGAVDVYICSAQTRSSSAVTTYGTGIMPVGTDRNITIGGYANNTGAISLYAVAYRRIGTNS